MRFLRALLSIPFVLAALAALFFGRSDLTWTGLAWCLASLALAAVIGFPHLPPRAVPIVLGGIVSLAAWRVVRAEGELRMMQMTTRGDLLPGSRWVDRLFEERDATIVAARFLSFVGAVHGEEFPELAELLAASYPRIEDPYAPNAQPILSTLFGLDHASTNVLVAGPHDAELAIVFLHGSAGSFTLQCAAVAGAVPEARTYCPSGGIEGAWRRPSWVRIARDAVLAAREGGAERVVVVGLSNGGIGLSHIHGELPADGFVFLAGASVRGSRPSRPSRLIHGTRDTMVPSAGAVAWARHRGVPVTLIEGSHFVLIEDLGAVRRALREFVLSRTLG